MPVNSRTSSNAGVSTRTSSGGGYSGRSTTSRSVQVQPRQSQSANTGGSSSYGSYGGGGGGSYDNSSYGGGGSDFDYSAAVAEANASAAAAREAAREQARNEQLARDNAAKIAEEAREKQAERKQEKPMRAASQQATPVQTAKSPEAKSDPSDQLRAPQVRADEVVGGSASEDILAQPVTTEVEGVGTVDTNTGEVVRTVPTAARRGRVEPNYDEGPQGEMSRSEIAAMVDALTPTVEQSSSRREGPNALNDQSDKGQARHMGNAPRHMRDQAREGRHQRYVPTRLSPEDLELAQEAYAQEREAEADGAGNITAIPGMSLQDTAWSLGSDITGVKSKDEQISKIISDENQRHLVEYNSMRGETGGDPGLLDLSGENSDISDIDAIKSESYIQKKLNEAGDKMLRRFLNPASLRIESEHVVTRTDRVNGETRTFGTIAYSENVNKAIGSVRRMYNCSIYNVMQLVQLRAGLGVDRNGTIAKVDPDKFRLTDDQFIELCRDIMESQRQNGHPLGSVQGMPGGSGVRDDTGRYVVVAKTRCFPLGYMPTQLIADLRRDWNSPLHQMSERQIQQMVGEEWLDVTYPTLCANTGGNLMFQARAIENMMRSLMRADGKNPADLKIPEVVERQTLMMHRAESMSTTDPQMASVIEQRQMQDEESLSRFAHRQRKRNGVRGEHGDIKSAYERSKMRKVERAFVTVGNLQRAANAAHVMVAVSSIPESIMAEGQMSLANLISDSWFKRQHGDVAKNYSMTEELSSMAQSKEAVEARSVAESLYRIGGLDMMRAFLSEKGDDGHARWKLTKADFRTFLQEWGVIGSSPTISDRVRSAFKIKPGEEAGFLLNVQNVVDAMDDLMLGSSNMFKTREARQFVQMSMSEMGRAAVATEPRESYTNEQVADWGRIGGGEAIVRSLLQTDAGIEAFMTQGITSLGRKSPVQNQMRVVMGANGLTQFAVRNMFDRFVEYGVNKVLRQVPLGNTLTYWASCGIKNMGDFLAAHSGNMPLGGVPNMAGAMQRNLDYSVGSRMSFKEGTLKNLRYDMVMAGSEIAKALVIYGIIQFLGGLRFPDDGDDRDRFTLSEWLIGDQENSLPIKWAWWMDDLAGLGLPLGFSLAILDQGGWDSDSLTTATNCFINQVANFNDGTSVFDAIDLVTNFPKHMDDFLGTNVKGYDPDFGEWANSFVEQKIWDLVGSMTPAFVSELIPWSKDYIFAGDRDAHTPYKVFDAGGRYSMEEAQSEYRTKDVGYAEAMRRRSSQTNVLQALFLDLFNGKDDTSYKYTEMPLDTQIDAFSQKIYNDFAIDLDKMPINQEERAAELRGHAEAVIQFIDNNYQNAAQANAGAFVLDYEARQNCKYWCYQMIKEEKQAFEDKLKNGYLPPDEYYTLKQNKDNQVDHYYYLISEFFDNEDIPWRPVRYVRQESDYETRYVTDTGAPATFVDRLLGNAHAENYLYGNVPSVLPASSPRSDGKGHNFETIPYWAVLDENGNPITNTGAMYDLAGQLGPITQGRNAGKDLLEMYWGGQGTNMWDGVSEELRIARDGVPTLGGGSGSSGGRPWRVMEDFLPDSLKNKNLAELLGLPPLEDEETSTTTDSGSGSSGGGSYYGGRSYYSGRGGYYSRGGGYYSGGGTYYSSYSGSGNPTYNPKIYANPRSVYGQRAAGLSVKQPYKATTTYLRPNFYTKGSREAYKRSDI